MFRFVHIFYLITCLGTSFNSLAQAEEDEPRREKVPSFFGFQIRPTFPVQFIGDPHLTMTKDGFTSTFTQKMGFSAGGVVRAGISKLFAIETGLSFTQRNFDLTMDIPDSNVHATNDLRFIEYDIPVNGLVYIQLAKQFYMNASLGASITFKPTDVGVLNLPGGTHSFRHKGINARKIGFALNANIGFEYRTKKAGIYYIGGSARVPFSPLFTAIAQYENQSYINQIIGKVDGSFLALDFKYFIPNINQKGPQWKRGPIL